MPVFNHNGLLEPGVHPMTFEEIKEFLGFNESRDYLLSELQRYLNRLKDLGVVMTKMYLDGSFVTDKATPGDIDLYFIVDINSLPNEPERTEFLKLINHDYCRNEFPLDVYRDFNCIKARFNFVEFYQYLGPKNAAIKQMELKDRKGIVELIL